ncbi:hypothetical protein HDU76_001878 [Blyttiomyces sp. JEL0837]|nr:hypothetical protein HDU76_001878 [Blyttiomyces sp. JEL0837]
MSNNSDILNNSSNNTTPTATPTASTSTKITSFSPQSHHSSSSSKIQTYPQVPINPSPIYSIQYSENEDTIIEPIMRRVWGTPSPPNVIAETAPSSVTKTPAEVGYILETTVPEILITQPSPSVSPHGGKQQPSIITEHCQPVMVAVDQHNEHIRDGGLAMAAENETGSWQAGDEDRIDASGFMAGESCNNGDREVPCGDDSINEKRAGGMVGGHGVEKWKLRLLEERRRAKENFEFLEFERDVCMQVLQEIETAKRHLITSVESYKTSSATLKDDNARLEAAMNRIYTDNITHRSRAAELWQAQCHQLSKAAEENLRINNTLENALAISESRQDEIDVLKAEVVSLRAAVTDLELLNGDLRESGEAMKIYTEEVSSELDKLRFELDESKCRCQEAEESRSILDTRCNGLVKRLEGSENKCKELQKVLEGVEDQLFEERGGSKELREEVGREREAREKAEREVEGLRGELEGLRRALKETEMRERVLEREVEGLHHQIASLTTSEKVLWMQVKEMEKEKE